MSHSCQAINRINPAINFLIAR